MRRVELLSALLLLAGCVPEPSPFGPCPDSSLEPPPGFDELSPGPAPPAYLAAWVARLADPARAGRRAGTAEAAEVAGLLADALGRRGLQSPDGGFCQGFPYVESEDRNVIAHLPGAPDAPWVVVTAHYDGRGVHPTGRILAGADDNASGVAALLEVARLAALGPELPVSVAFVLLGAEEFGFVGARKWSKRPSVPLERVRFVLNLDMVGRQRPDGTPGLGYHLPGETPEELRERLIAAGVATGIQLAPLTTWHEAELLLSDSTVLAEKLPAVLISTGLHEDHHRAGDTFDKIDPGQIERAVRVTLEVLENTG